MSRSVLRGLPAAILIASISLPAAAQMTAGPVYDAAHYLPTNIRGVTSFEAAPSGFDAIRATDTELARYGLPPRPDAAKDPVSYQRWVAAMSAHPRKSSEPIRELPMAAGPARGLKAAPEATESTNWSGIVNTVPVTAWNARQSFAEVVGEWTVPLAQEAFATGGGNVCDAGRLEVAVVWAGIDGWADNVVLQGGSYSGAECGQAGTPPSTAYCAWAEWYPENGIICQFDINPGDVIYSEIWNTSPTTGYVYLQDKTLNIYTTVALTVPSIAALEGNSAEYIIERPYDDGYLPLLNYVANLWANSEAWTFARLNKTTAEVPGSRRSTNAIVGMNVDGITVSAPAATGPGSIYFTAENCALSGGCSW